MKRTITLLSLLIIALKVFSQPTITQSNLPKVGEVWVAHTDTASSPIQPTPPGAWQIWDYAGSLNATAPDVEIYEPASIFPDYTSMPGATLATNDDDETDFYSTSSSGLYAVGYYNPPAPYNPVVYTPALLYIPVPFTYGSMQNSASKSVTITYDSGNYEYDKEVFAVNETFNADAFGTLTTPSALAVQVLRVNVTFNLTDSFFIGPLQTQYYLQYAIAGNGGSYMFLKDGSNCLVMEIDYDSIPSNVQEVTYYDNHIPAGINEVGRSEVFTNVYPNPSHASAITITIEGGQAQQLKIYNIAGQCIETENVEGISTINISNPQLTAGLYFYQIIDKSGNVIGSRKFIVQ